MAEDSRSRAKYAKELKDMIGRDVAEMSSGGIKRCPNGGVEEIV
jgi:hypothetical protein